MRKALENHALVLIEDRFSKYPYGFFAFTGENMKFTDSHNSFLSIRYKVLFWLKHF